MSSVVRVVHLSLNQFNDRVSPDHYVVTLLCGLMAWGQLKLYNDARRRYLSFFRGYKDLPVLGPSSLTRYRRHVTCLACLAVAPPTRRSKRK